MHITKVELENIKSHADSTFEFSHGTTAITGPNGAGKTTIIEAIAWTIFDLLDYKKDVFLRRGSKKGWARVSFVSGKDEREYTVYRDTGTGYYVFDPRLDTRLAEKKEDVARFLWEHLCVDPGTDLELLFKHAIGVPQGTLTAIFLGTPAERKRTFDTLLKVEEYRRGAEELLKTQRFVESQIGETTSRIDRFQGELSQADRIGSDLDQMRSEVDRLEAEYAKLQETEKKYAEKMALLEQQKSAVETVRQQKDKLAGQVEKAELVFRQVESDLKKAREAASKIESVREAAEKYAAALLRLAELERERGERDKLVKELSKIESAQTTVLSDRKHVRADIKEIEKAHAELSSLTPAAEEQAAVEKKIAELKEKLAGLKSIKQQITFLDEKLESLRAVFRQHQSDIKTASAKAAGAENAAGLRSREGEIIRELAKLSADLDRDEKFQKEIQNGLCPILSEKCLNMKEGQTLESFLKDQFVELRTSITLLEKEQNEVAQQMVVAREAEIYAGKLATLEERYSEIEEEGRKLRSERDVLEHKATDLTDIENELKKEEIKLEKIGDPRSRIAVLREKLKREPDLRSKITLIESNLERLESDKRIIAEQLDRYVHVDDQWRAVTAERDETSEANKTFLSHERSAGQLPMFEREHSEAKDKLHSLKKNLVDAEAKYAKAEAAYDSAKHMDAKNSLLDVQRDIAAVGVKLDNAKTRHKELESESARLDEIKRSLAHELVEKERHEKLLETTVFIRDTLKEAAPLVARNYVFHVSAEANLLFREITGDAERTLKWAEDYGIFLEEGGYERPFQSLSGGEQMAAALSVRLALLKQLSDIRIAFFDEPTANMDADRRENLAMQIGQISDFDQLFVISHDDTFEGYMDHELSLGA